MNTQTTETAQVFDWAAWQAEVEALFAAEDAELAAEAEADAIAAAMLGDGR